MFLIDFQQGPHKSTHRKIIRAVSTVLREQQLSLSNCERRATPGVPGARFSGAESDAPHAGLQSKVKAVLVALVGEAAILAVLRNPLSH